ncbi:uncharacterized protein LOC116433527 [Nomia melanderi]|uniref:uncharacterized protein LOC116433527 n=1 Tax=Nomia melanderi TaxID=2448451 RepID=UPI0013046C3B|nr:uncharacterized protein LOC116433527 [Nomia melanderi]
MSFHDFNKFTGQLKQSTQSQPLYPLSPQPLDKREPRAMMFDSKKTKPVSTSLSKSNYSTVPAKIKELQKRYQADLSVPSYLLAGKRDVLLFRFTVALTTFGFFANLYKWYQIEKKGN